MASLTKDGQGWRIQFTDPVMKTKRRTVRTGKCNKSSATTAKSMVENLIEAKQLGQAIKPSTAAWLESIEGTPLQKRLAKVGLCEATDASTVQAFLEGVIGQRVRRGNVKKCTVTSWGHTKRNLIEFFGGDRQINTITSADADEWAAWLVDHENLAENTVRKRSANAKMFFRVALRRKQIAENPFQALVGSVVASRGRQYFIPRETVTALLDQCHGPEYRLLLLFARYMGVRIPSEIVPLKWTDIDWANQRIVITSPKTERHPGGEKRLCPIFPEVFSALLEASENAPDGAVYIFPSIRSNEKNLRTWLERAIIAAGFTPWPRLWQNFRATRATELADKFPSRVAASWLGHSEQIADRNYRQVTAEHFRKAIEQPTGAMPTKERKPQGNLTQKPAHSTSIPANLGTSRNEQNPENPGIDGAWLVMGNHQVGDDGLEPPTSTV